VAVTARDVEDAAARLRDVVAPTPVERSPRLSDRVAGEVFLKREDLQVVRSYKVRGAYNLISQLPAPDRAKGVVCASAGNHAQGLAYACSALGVPGRVFLPGTTPRQKRDRIAVLGGDVVAGQGTVVLEAFAQLDQVPDVVVLPVGGGGLIAGALSWLGTHHPGVRVVGVEPAGAACMAAAVKAGEPVRLEEIDRFVDGAAVRRAGDVTFPVVRDSAAELVAVAEGRVCTEMLALYQSDGIIAEPAGALAAAALGDVVHVEPGASTLVVLSGGNNDVSRYGEIVERALVYEGRKHYFLVDFPQEPGALRRFLDEVLGPDDDITLFEYVKRNNRETGPALVGIELSRPEDLDALLARMAAAPPDISPVPPDSPLFRFLL
jgi:threonine dehydratase